MIVILRRTLPVLLCLSLFFSFRTPPLTAQESPPSDFGPRNPLARPLVDLGMMVEHADTIVRGRVIASRSGWDHEERVIFTDHLLQVHYLLAGT
ncbi:MAG: hypothetical protein D6775_16845, partial [Caldilineae bacterium]